jgi:hypothetical protein
MFINPADNSEDIPNVDKDQPKYGSYRLSKTEWESLILIEKVLAVRGTIVITISHCLTHQICSVRPWQQSRRPFLQSITLPCAYPPTI